MNSHLPSPYEPPQPPRSRTPLLLLVLSVGALLLVSIRFGDRALSDDRATASPRPVTARGDLAADEKSTIELFERCSPSVVYISPLVRAVRRTFLGYVDGGVVESGTGSGFVWDEQGHVVTNFHVIKNASGAMVTLPDNTRYPADIIGYWPDNDLAVLRIDAPREKLQPITVGTSSDLRVGQKVFAIGNPYGLDFTLTTGIVSALNREIRAVTGDKIGGVIQTDAAINPGNSGGPLLDSAGRLIGVNTAIFSQSGSSAGIGFAVPVDTVNAVVPQLIAHGKIIRPGLGVSIASDQLAPPPPPARRAGDERVRGQRRGTRRLAADPRGPRRSDHSGRRHSRGERAGDAIQPAARRGFVRLSGGRNGAGDHRSQRRTDRGAGHASSGF
jgi:S1-C subfamily serine protease